MNQLYAHISLFFILCKYDFYNEHGELVAQCTLLLHVDFLAIIFIGGSGPEYLFPGDIVIIKLQVTFGLHINE